MHEKAKEDMKQMHERQEYLEDNLSKLVEFLTNTMPKKPSSEEGANVDESVSYLIYLSNQRYFVGLLSLNLD